MHLDNSVEDGADDGVDSADKHLTHLSQGFDCHLTQKSKQSKHDVGNKEDDVDNGVEDGVEDGVDDGVDD
eukprot:15323912-Ditylum_brightwellii.AAC.1